MSEEGRLTVALEFQDDWLGETDHQFWVARDRQVVVLTDDLLCNACLWGNAHLVKMCLACPAIDPSSLHNRPLLRAVEHGHLEVVKLLLADPRVNPNDRNGFIVATAMRNRHVNVALCLITHPRTDPTLDIQGAIFWAADYNLPDLVRVLLEDPRVFVLEDTIRHAAGESRKLLVAHEKWGVSSQRLLYEEYHWGVVQEYDATLAQALTVAWLAEQVIIWRDLVWPMSDRIKASFII
jgi:hypothetical protein